MTIFEHIKIIVCQGEGIMPELLDRSPKRRQRELVFCRQAIFFFMRKFTKDSLVMIGSHFGKDHATVIHSCRTIQNIMDTDRNVNAKMQIYEEKIKMLIEFNYGSKLKSIKIIKRQIEYCIDNGIEIPEDLIAEYNLLIKDR
jgi:hypothetical protein